MSGADQRLFTGLKALAPERGFRRNRPASQGVFTTGVNGSLLSLHPLTRVYGEPVSVNQLLGVCDEAPDMRSAAATSQQPETALAPGSLLVTGDPGSGKTRLLRRLMISAAAHTTPEQAGFYLAAHQPAQFCDIGHLEHCRLVMQTYDRTLGAAVQELVDLAEERRVAILPGPAVILVIDDLASALLNLSEQSITLLYWLIRHGPRQRVWTLATLSTRRLADLDLRFLEAFRSRVVGHISNPELAHLLLQRPEAFQNTAYTQPTLLEKGRQFLLPYGFNWIVFRLYEPRLASPAEGNIGLWSGTA